MTATGSQGSGSAFRDRGRARPARPDRLRRGTGGVRIAFETFGSGEPTVSCCRRRRSSTRASGRARCSTSAGAAGSSPSTAAATVDRTARPIPGPYREAAMVGDIEAVMDATGTAAAILVGLCGDGVWRAIQLAAAKPDRVLGIVAFAPGVPHLAPPHPWKTAVVVRRRAADRRGLGQAQPPLLAARLRRVRPVLLRGDHLRAALDQADRRRGRLGARRVGRRDARRHGRRADLGPGDRSRRPVGRSAVRWSSSTARRTPASPSRARSGCRS